MISFSFPLPKIVSLAPINKFTILKVVSAWDSREFLILEARYFMKVWSEKFYHIGAYQWPAKNSLWKLVPVLPKVKDTIWDVQALSHNPTNEAKVVPRLAIPGTKQVTKHDSTTELW